MFDFVDCQETLKEIIELLEKQQIKVPQQFLFTTKSQISLKSQLQLNSRSQSASLIKNQKLQTVKKEDNSTPYKIMIQNERLVQQQSETGKQQVESIKNYEFLGNTFSSTASKAFGQTRTFDLGQLNEKSRQQEIFNLVCEKLLTKDRSTSDISIQDFTTPCNLEQQEKQQNFSQQKVSTARKQNIDPSQTARGELNNSISQNRLSINSNSSNNINYKFTSDFFVESRQHDDQSICNNYTQAPLYLEEQRYHEEQSTVEQVHYDQIDDIKQDLNQNRNSSKVQTLFGTDGIQQLQFSVTQNQSQEQMIANDYHMPQNCQKQRNISTFLNLTKTNQLDNKDIITQNNQESSKETKSIDAKINYNNENLPTSTWCRKQEPKNESTNFPLQINKNCVNISSKNTNSEPQINRFYQILPENPNCGKLEIFQKESSQLEPHQIQQDIILSNIYESFQKNLTLLNAVSRDRSLQSQLEIQDQLNALKEEIIEETLQSFRIINTNKSLKCLQILKLNTNIIQTMKKANSLVLNLNQAKEMDVSPLNFVQTPNNNTFHKIYQQQLQNQKKIILDGQILQENFSLLARSISILETQGLDDEQREQMTNRNSTGQMSSCCKFLF